MTQAEFTAFYPQFAGFTPAVVLTEYIRQANARFSSFTEEDAEEARRLYAAHRLTLYARVALPTGEEPTTASGGNLVGSEVTGNEQSPQWGAATIDGAGRVPSKAVIAAAGQAQQRVASKKVGEVSVTYSSGTSSASSSVSTGLAGLTETEYGLQLLGLIRLYSRSVYVP